MSTNYDKWPMIKVHAQALGAKPSAVNKWRERNVPAKWAMRLVREVPGVFTLDDFASRVHVQAQEDAQ